MIHYYYIISAFFINAFISLLPMNLYLLNAFLIKIEFLFGKNQKKKFENRILRSVTVSRDMIADHWNYKKVLLKVLLKVLIKSTKSLKTPPGDAQPVTDRKTPCEFSHPLRRYLTVTCSSSPGFSRFQTPIVTPTRKYIYRAATSP